MSSDGVMPLAGRVLSCSASGSVVSLPAVIAAEAAAMTPLNPPVILALPAAQPGILRHRVREVLWHIPWYGFKTQARLAQDSGVSPAAISRLLRGESQPSLLIALRLVRALSRRLGRPLDVGEVFSLDGTYPTPSVCRLTGCRNCLPPPAYDGDERLLPDFRGVPAGAWSLPLAGPDANGATPELALKHDEKQEEKPKEKPGADSRQNTNQNRNHTLSQAKGGR
jgi:transcriptional regulator with XRE-family HTH domain